MLRKVILLILCGSLIFATVLLETVPEAAAGGRCSSASPLELNRTVSQTISRLTCFELRLDNGLEFLALTIVPSANSQFDLFLAKTRQLNDTNHKLNMSGSISSRSTYAFQNIRPGIYTVGLAPLRRSSRFELTAKTRQTSAQSSRAECSNGVCRQTHPLTAESDIDLSAEWGDRAIFPIDTICPGPITARATWLDSEQELALIINGPGQVGYYNRTDGPSPLTVEYTISPEDTLKGSRWQVSLVNFSRQPVRAGNIEIDYPDSESCDADLLTLAGMAQWGNSAGAELTFPGNATNFRTGYAYVETNARLENQNTAPQVLVTHPPLIRNGSIYAVYPHIRIKEGDSFKSEIGYIARSSKKGDCFWALGYLDGDSYVELARQPKKYSGKLTSFEVNLSPLAGQEVQLVLSVTRNQLPKDFVPVWVAPRIVR